MSDMKPIQFSTAMISLLKATFELAVKKCWLNQIEKAINKNNRLNQKARRQAYIARKLMEQYNKIYGSEDIQISRSIKQEGDR